MFKFEYWLFGYYDVYKITIIDIWHGWPLTLFGGSVILRQVIKKTFKGSGYVGIQVGICFLSSFRKKIKL